MAVFRRFFLAAALLIGGVFCTRCQTQVDFPVVITGNSICARWLKAHPNYFSSRGYANVGISGETSTQIAERFRRDVMSKSPSVVVIVSPATNDVAENQGPVTDEFVLSNIMAMVQEAKAGGARVVLASNLPATHFFWHPGIEPTERLERLNATTEQLARDMGLTWLDFYTPFLDNDGRFDGRYHVDGCHPSEQAFDAMERMLDAALAPLSAPDACR